MSDLMRAVKNENHFYKIKHDYKRMKFTMSLGKVVLQIEFSDKKPETNFRKIKLILDLENWHRKQNKKTDFYSPQSKVLKTHLKDF